MSISRTRNSDFFCKEVDRVAINRADMKMPATPLKAVLLLVGIRQRQLADMVEVHESLISDLCRGRRNPDGVLAHRISKALGMRPEDIFPRGTA